MSLITRNLFDDLFSLHRELDTLFERSWNSLGRCLPETAAHWGGFFPEVDTYTKDASVVYRLAIPGVDPNDVELSIVGGEIIVKGERKSPTEVKDENWLVRNFRYGRFERTFRVPEGVDLDKVNATFHNGLLEITVPASRAALPRKIEIKQIESGGEKVKLKASA
jgi:HSP20 family protein